MLPYVLTAGLAWLAEASGGLSVRILVLPIIAALQNHLQILLHEGAHFQIHPKKRWNDLMTNVFCAVPFFGLISHYRHFHLAHHKYLLDPEEDPEVGFYAEQNHFFEKKRAPGLLWMLILDVCGYHYFQFFFSYNLYLLREMRKAGALRPARGEWLAVGLTLAPALALVLPLHAGKMMLFYWLLPQPTFMFLFLKLQGYGEHTARARRIEDCTFSHELGLGARFFIYPLNSDLHLEHHLYPSVPWYRLRRLHQRLARDGGTDPASLRGYFFGRTSVLRTLLLESDG